jgi:hypothetical protein
LVCQNCDGVRCGACPPTPMAMCTGAGGAGYRICAGAPTP